MNRVNTWLKMIIVLVVLTPFVACSESATGVNKYSLSTNWQTLPADASQPVDVFFLYPTTYFPDPNSNGPVYSSCWNQTIEQAQGDPGIGGHVAHPKQAFSI